MSNIIENWLEQPMQTAIYAKPFKTRMRQPLGNRDIVRVGKLELLGHWRMVLRDASKTKRIHLASFTNMDPEDGAEADWIADQMNTQAELPELQEALKRRGVTKFHAINTAGGCFGNFHVFAFLDHISPEKDSDVQKKQEDAV